MDVMIMNASKTVEKFEEMNRLADKQCRRTQGPREPDEFDPDRYLNVMPHVTLEDGYCLDYLYYQNDFVGYPWLYAKAQGSPPPREAVFPMPAELSPLQKFIPDGTPESWLELEIFARLGANFALFQHAWYGDFTFITNKEQIRALGERIGAPPDFSEQALGWPHLVTVCRGAVEYTGFSQSSGLVRYRSTYTPGKREITELKAIPFKRGLIF